MMSLSAIAFGITCATTAQEAAVANRWRHLLIGKLRVGLRSLAFVMLSPIAGVTY